MKPSWMPPPRLVALGAMATSCAAWVCFPPPAACVESIYSTRVFPAIARVLVPAVDAVPFSESAVLLLVTVVALVAWPIHRWRAGGVRGETRTRRLLVLLEAASWVAVIGYALFVVLWGANYRRERARDRLGLDVRSPTAEEFRAWVERLDAAVRKDATPAEGRDGERALEALRGSLERVLEEWHGVRPRLPTRVKRLPAGLLLAFGTAGVTTPILEPHVDAGEPEVAFLATSAHELSHAGGICAEADADLAAAFAGLRADDAYARYSVELHLLLHFSAYLPQGERARLREGLPPVVRDDIAAMDAARNRYRIATLSGVQRRIYDSYLRFQGLREGIREYSQIVGLLVAAGRKGLP